MAIVTYDFKDLPKPTQEDLNRLDAIRDEDIDYSEMPALTERDWDRAMTYSQFLAHVKQKNKHANR